MKYLLFGTGDYYNRYKKWFEDKEVVALVDNSSTKQGTKLDGRMVLSPQDALKLKYDVIVILSFYVKAMKTQLIALGADESKICHFFQLHDLIKDDYRKRDLLFLDESDLASSGQKHVLLMSHDLNLGGPALALMNVAVFLKKNNYGVTFVSMINGPLVDFLTEKHIPVIVDENLQIQTMQESRWNEGYDLIICNTINYYVFLSERNLDVPVLWWLHDSRFFYDGVDARRLKSLPLNNLTCASVGRVPANAIHEFIPNLMIYDLLYGVQDVIGQEFPGRNRKDSVVRFTTIGYIEYRKGQDILIEAIELLPVSILKKCEFMLVGQNDSLMAKEIMKRTRNIPQIKITGPVNREEIHRILNETDILLCPSREDPMPTVAAEAMMHGVSCVISDATGTSGYITNHENGIIIENENSEQLREAIVWCVEHSDERIEYGKKAREIFENVFTIEVFEKQVESIVNKCFII